MPPFVQLATILSGSQHLLESGGSKSIATASSGRKRTLTDGRSQIRHAAALPPVQRLGFGTKRPSVRIRPRLPVSFIFRALAPIMICW